LLISKKIKSDSDTIVDVKDRSGALGWIIAGKDAAQKKLTDIKFKKDPKDYDLVIIGGPVWSWNVTPAIRVYVKTNAKSLKTKRFAFFATQGSSGAETKFKSMQDIIGKKPVATLVISGKDIRDESYKKKIEGFVADITK